MNWPVGLCFVIVILVSAAQSKITDLLKSKAEKEKDAKEAANAAYKACVDKAKSAIAKALNEQDAQAPIGFTTVYIADLSSSGKSAQPTEIKATVAIKPVADQFKDADVSTTCSADGIVGREGETQVKQARLTITGTLPADKCQGLGSQRGFTINVRTATLQCKAKASERSLFWDYVAHKEGGYFAVDDASKAALTQCSMLNEVLDDGLKAATSKLAEVAEKLNTKTGYTIRSECPKAIAEKFYEALGKQCKEPNSDKNKSLPGTLTAGDYEVTLAALKDSCNVRLRCKDDDVFEVSSKPALPWKFLLSGSQVSTCRWKLWLSNGIGYNVIRRPENADMHAKLATHFSATVKSGKVELLTMYSQKLVTDENLPKPNCVADTIRVGESEKLEFVKLETGVTTGVVAKPLVEKMIRRAVEAALA